MYAPHAPTKSPKSPLSKITFCNPNILWSTKSRSYHKFSLKNIEAIYQSISQIGDFLKIRRSPLRRCLFLWCSVVISCPRAGLFDGKSKRRPPARPPEKNGYRSAKIESRWYLWGQSYQFLNRSAWSGPLNLNQFRNGHCTQKSFTDKSKISPPRFGLSGFCIPSFFRSFFPPLLFSMEPQNASFMEVLLSEPIGGNTGIDLPVASDTNPPKAEKPRKDDTTTSQKLSENKTGKKPATEIHGPMETPANDPDGIDDELEEYIKQLDNARNKALKLKEASLIGRVFGDPIDFAKIKMKITKDWRFILGEFQFIPKANNWFELRFTNIIDKKKVWDGRPFHVFGQVLILRNWTPEFDPFTENISRIDTWVRIPALPMELCNPEVIQAIVKRHNLGSFVKYDINNERKSGNKYPRFCINVDMAGKVRGEILVPKGKIDESSTSKGKRDFTKLNVWFEDFPEGCGNCGLMDHTYTNCPIRTAKPKKIQITILRTSEKGESENKVSGADAKDCVVENEWESVGKKTNTNPETNSKVTSTKPYLDGSGGVEVNVITTDSVIQANTSKGKETPKQTMSSPQKVINVSVVEVENQIQKEGLEKIQRLLDVDDILDDNDDNITYFDEDFLTEDIEVESNLEKAPSNASFHSLNSADGSVIIKMGSLKVHKEINSVTNSGKRTMDEDDMDTASSGANGGNKKKKTG